MFNVPKHPIYITCGLGLYISSTSEVISRYLSISKYHRIIKHALMTNHGSHKRNFMHTFSV